MLVLHRPVEPAAQLGHGTTPPTADPGLQDIELVEISQEVLERFYKPVMNSRRFNWSNCI